MLVRLFEVRAEDLIHLVGDPGGVHRATGGGSSVTSTWPDATRCLEIALSSEEQDPLASRAVLGHHLARIWGRLVPSLVPEEEGLVHLLRIQGNWDDPNAINLVTSLGLQGRRFSIAGAARVHTRDPQPPLVALLEATPAQIVEAIEQWGDSGLELGLEVVVVSAEAAPALLRSDGRSIIPVDAGAREIRLYMTTSRDRRSLFLISDHSADTVRHLLEGAAGR